MSHAPWSKAQEEQWANEYMFERHMRPDEAGSKLLFDSFLAGLAKAAEIIEASPTIKTGDPMEEHWFAENVEVGFANVTAKLVGVKPIEGRGDK